MGSEPIPLLQLNWNEWDGGKCGGRPIWLNLLDIPHPDDLKCKHCQQPMAFLLQVYSPLDQPPEAYHRALYVFICHHRECVEKFASIKCLRSQLFRKNDFYAEKPTEDKNGKSGPLFKGTLPHLCAVCGCRAPHQCSKCKIASYCSREHQRAHWKYHKTTCSQTVDSLSSSDGTIIANKQISEAKSNLSLLFPEYEISVTAEVLVDCAEDARDDSVLKAHVWEDAVVNADGKAVSAPDNESDDDDDDEEKDDTALTQNDYSKALGNDASDSVYMKFIERVRRGGPHQVLRYVRWDDEEGPLQLSSESYLSSAPDNENNQLKAVPIPRCQHCGAPRKFEFQVRSGSPDQYIISNGKRLASLCFISQRR
jgi:pre-rRNA-processing protein TSR4